MSELTQGEKQTRLRLLWTQACAHDDIPPQTPMVVFSEGNPYSVAYDEAFRELHPVKEFICWTSHSCYVCNGGTGKPKIHVGKKYRPTSPCDSVTTTVKASSRATALKAYKVQLRIGDMWKPNLSPKENPD